MRYSLALERACTLRCVEYYKLSASLCRVVVWRLVETCGHLWTLVESAASQRSTEVRCIWCTTGHVWCGSERVDSKLLRTERPRVLSPVPTARESQRLWGYPQKTVLLSCRLGSAPSSAEDATLVMKLLVSCTVFI